MRSFHLHRPTCPDCRGTTTHLDTTRFANLWRLPVALLSGFIAHPICTVLYRCRGCATRFHSTANPG